MGRPCVYLDPRIVVPLAMSIPPSSTTTEDEATIKVYPLEDGLLIKRPGGETRLSRPCPQELIAVIEYWAHPPKTSREIVFEKLDADPQCSYAELARVSGATLGSVKVYKSKWRKQLTQD